MAKPKLIAMKHINDQQKVLSFGALQPGTRYTRSCNHHGPRKAFHLGWLHLSGRALICGSDRIEASAHMARCDKPGAMTATAIRAKHLAMHSCGGAPRSQEEPAISSKRDWILSDHLALI
jgi:hypothetical protein